MKMNNIYTFVHFFFLIVCRNVLADYEELMKPKRKVMSLKEFNFTRTSFFEFLNQLTFRFYVIFIIGFKKEITVFRKHIMSIK